MHVKEQPSKYKVYFTGSVFNPVNTHTLVSACRAQLRNTQTYHLQKLNS